MKNQFIISILAACVLAACQSSGNSATTSNSTSSQTASQGICQQVRGDSSSGGRNVLYRCSGSAVLNSAEAQSILGSGARVSFANEGSVIKANLTTRQAANRVGHSDEQTCVRAFINAAKKFQETAAKNGGHRVTHLHSYLNKNALSGGQYECEVGTFHGRVLMRDNIAR